MTLSYRSKSFIWRPEIFDDRFSCQYGDPLSFHGEGIVFSIGAVAVFAFVTPGVVDESAFAVCKDIMVYHTGSVVENDDVMTTASGHSGNAGTKVTSTSI